MRMSRLNRRCVCMPGMGVGGEAGGRIGAVNETETFEEDEENAKREGGGGGGGEEGDKRNVKSKKQKGRKNKSTARELGGDDRNGRRRDTAGQCKEGIGERRDGPRILK